jgi:hypothetical protein
MNEAEVVELRLVDDRSDHLWLGRLSTMDGGGDYQLTCPAAYNIAMMLNLELSDSLLLDSHCFAHVD